jgi:RND family efflux transporter MFP subunit
MSARRRRWPWIFGGAAVLATGGWLLASFPRETDVTWVEARVDDLVIGVEIEGSLQSRNSSYLGPPPVPEMWDYKISFLATEGNEVEPGTPVLGFDVTELTRRLRERQTESEEAAKKIEQLTKDLVRRRMADDLKLAEARARARKARLKIEVPEEFEKGQVLEEARLDLELADTEIAHLESRLSSSERSGEAALDVLRSQKERADQQVSEIQESIDRMMVKAPREGTVIHVSDWRGEKMKIGDSCWRGRKVVELPDLKAMMAKGEVDEADAGRIREGQAFRARLDAHPDVEYTGKVESIWRTVQRKSWRNPIKVVRLDLKLNETDTQRMRPGMRFRGSVEIERLEKVLVVPSHAVFLTTDGPVVFRRTLLGHEKVPVRLGRRNDEVVEVVEGLEPGDRVAERNLERRERDG